MPIHFHGERIFVHMNNMVHDQVDMQILNLLLQDAELPHKEIGQRVHLTGQAVGARIRKLKEAGVIEGFALRWNPEKIGLSVHAFITVFMKAGSTHQPFQRFAGEHEHVMELHRVTAEGCYWMRVRVGTPKQLNEFLDKLLPFGNYKVSLSLEQLK